MDASRGFRALESDGVPPIEVAFPDLGRWSAGNAGLPYTWTFEPQRLTTADFGGKSVKVKVWSPYKQFRETIYLVPDT